MIPIVSAQEASSGAAAQRPAEVADIAHYMRPGTLQLAALPPLSLYIHLPWCLKKCPYCDFNSHELAVASHPPGCVPVWHCRPTWSNAT